MFCETLVEATAPRRPPQWTARAVARLRELWPDHGCRHIAVKLADEGFGSFTRAAVIGKVHRLGLSAKQKEKVHPNTPFSLVLHMHLSFAHQIGGDASKILHAIKRQQKEGTPKISPEPFVCRAVPDIEPRHISLLDLQHNDCRWPCGEGPFTFCGHPKAIGSSYCPAHQTIARGEGTPAERAAHRIPKEAA